MKSCDFLRTNRLAVCRFPAILIALWYNQCIGPLTRSHTFRWKCIYHDKNDSSALLAISVLIHGITWWCKSLRRTKALMVRD